MKEIVVRKCPSSPKVVGEFITIDDIRPESLIVALIKGSNNQIGWVTLISVNSDFKTTGFEQPGGIVEGNDCRHRRHFINTYSDNNIQNALVNISNAYIKSEFYLIENLVDLKHIWERLATEQRWQL